jgi:hypothetical protein
MTVPNATVMDRRGVVTTGNASTPRLNRLAWILSAVALAHALFILVAWLNAPLLDQHDFRQTQTALSSYWLLHGGPVFAYETPVLGSPWSIPFEFPLYQGLVAGLAATGVPLDAAGRLVSFAFFVAGFWPLRMLWADLRLPPLGLPIACALLLAAPEYAFWSRTFLMESCAWFFALLWLALFVRFLMAGRATVALAATLAGVVGILVKATTLPAFALIGGLFYAARGVAWLRAGLPRRDLARLTLALVALLLPFAVGIAWVIDGDAVKLANPVGRLLTSAALEQWNYGTLAQRTGSLLWLAIMPQRMLFDMFGPAWGVALVILAWALYRRRNTSVILLLVLGFFVPILIFTNLYIIHNYYLYANAAFLIAAVAVALGALADSPRGAARVCAVLVVILISQFTDFYLRQIRWLRTDPGLHAPYQIALAARDLIPPDGSLVVLGEQWSSVVPYYSQRKALVVPTIVSPGLLQDLLRDPASHLAGTRYAGVVDCGSWDAYGSEGRKLVEQFLAGRAVLATRGFCRLLAAAK